MYVKPRKKMPHDYLRAYGSLHDSKGWEPGFKSVKWCYNDYNAECA